MFDYNYNYNKPIQHVECAGALGQSIEFWY